MKKAFIAIAAVASFSTLASDLSWDYVGAGYQVYDFDDESIKFNGLGLRGSKVLLDHLYVEGRYSSTKTDDTQQSLGESADLSQTQFAVGYFWPAQENVHLYSKLLYIDQQLEIGSVKESIDGHGAAAGVRIAATSLVELDFSVERLKADGIYETRYDASLNLQIAPSIDLVGEYSKLEDVTATYVGVRYHF